MSAPLPLRRRLIVSIAALLGGVALILGLTVPGSLGAYTAKVANNGNNVATSPSFTCAYQATNARAYLAYPLGPVQTVQPLGASDVSGNARTGSYSVKGVTYGVPSPCPRDGYRAITLDGVNGAVSGPSTALAMSTVTSYTEQIWFRATGAGGYLMGFGDSATGASGDKDRNVYLTDAGNVVAGVFPGSVQTVQSPGTYFDGAWHQVVVTQGLGTDANPGLRLYVDGALVASNTSLTGAQTNYSGYLRIGYDSLLAWTNRPANDRFAGSLAWAAFYNGTALTPSVIRNQYLVAQSVPTTTMTNLALGRTASQGSTAFGGPAALAVDGNTDATYSNGSSSHTDIRLYSWWMVDLGSVKTVDRIEIWNRLDCCSDRLADYWVFSSATAFNTALTPTLQSGVSGVTSSHQTVQAGSPTTVTVGASARYVMIQLSGLNYLTLPEVQVIGS